MMTMTYHARVERQARIQYIMENIGIGETVATKEKPREGKKELLTDTGIILVTNTAETILITMFIASIDKAYALYINDKKEPLPRDLRNTIVHNRYYLENQP